MSIKDCLEERLTLLKIHMTKTRTWWRSVSRYLTLNDLLQTADLVLHNLKRCHIAYIAEFEDSFQCRRVFLLNVYPFVEIVPLDMGEISNFCISFILC